MTEGSAQDRAVELFQQLGLKEYEAKSFVALTRLSRGTAKEVSDISEVPRTRVYDAVRVLESKGLVETQHLSPRVFRAVAVDQAIEILRQKYNERVDSLGEALGSLTPVDRAEPPHDVHEVWSLTGEEAIANRTRTLIDDADEEVLFLSGEETGFDERLAARLEAAQARNVTVVVGTGSEPSRERVQAALPDAAVFVSDQTWLQPPTPAGDDTEISRLMLTDRETILVSTVKRDAGRHHEHAAFGDGFDNGFVAIARRLLVSGLSRDEGLEPGEL